MSLSDLDIAHGFEHSNDMGTESWRIDVVTRIETILDTPEVQTA